MLSAGLGGTGVIPSRPNDRFGIGVFHLEVSDLFIEPRVGIGDEQGIEAFYNMAVLPWLGVTADVQRVNGTLQSADSAWIVSGRLNVAL